MIISTNLFVRILTYISHSSIDKLLHRRVEALNFTKNILQDKENEITIMTNNYKHFMSRIIEENEMVKLASEYRPNTKVVPLFINMYSENFIPSPRMFPLEFETDNTTEYTQEPCDWEDDSGSEPYGSCHYMVVKVPHRKYKLYLTKNELIQYRKSEPEPEPEPESESECYDLITNRTHLYIIAKKIQKK